MAERLGRRARWTAALVAAPGAAALFGTATSWALHAAPDTASTPPPPEQHTRQPADPAVVGAQRSAAANRQQLQKLEKQLARLRTQVAALGTSPTTPPGGASAGAASGPPAGTAAPPAPSPAASNPPARTYPAPPPPPPAPPPVQTSTGASGAPK
jgi:hypothetical protein